MIEDREFKYTERPLAQELATNGVTDLYAAFDYIRNLPYGRNNSREGYLTILQEGKGTCSSKHAFLQSLLQEQELNGWELIIGLYKMNSQNTPKVAEVLTHYQLDYIPEAHTYLRNNNETFDLTFVNSTFINIKDDILKEISIEPSMVVTFKEDFHKNYLADWIRIEKKPFTFDELWSIREQCILKLTDYDNQTGI